MNLCNTRLPGRIEKFACIRQASDAGLDIKEIPIDSVFLEVREYPIPVGRTRHVFAIKVAKRDLALPGKVNDRALDALIDRDGAEKYRDRFNRRFRNFRNIRVP